MPRAQRRESKRSSGHSGTAAALRNRAGGLPHVVARGNTQTGTARVIAVSHARVGMCCVCLCSVAVGPFSSDRLEDLDILTSAGVGGTGESKRVLILCAVRWGNAHLC